MTEQLVLSVEFRQIEELKNRQDQFAILLELDPENLRHLRLCSECNGYDYQWTDWSRSELPDNGFVETGEQTRDYRAYLTRTACRNCDATGFEGGNSEFTPEEWVLLGRKLETIV